MESIKNISDAVYKTTELLVYFVSPVFLCYFSLKKCFLKEKKGRLKLFLLILFAGPFPIYFVSVMLTRTLWNDVLQMSSFLYWPVNRSITMGLAMILFISLIFLLSKGIGRWLHVPNRELVTFVLLMYSVVLILSMQDDLVKDEADWMFSYMVETLGNILLMVAGLLLYQFVIKELSALTDKRREVNARLFTIPPILFIMVYTEVATAVVNYAYYHSFNDGVALEFALSILFLLVFIWSMTERRNMSY